MLSPTVFSYRACGLSIASDIHLPGLFRAPPDETCDAVTIRRAPVSFELKGASGSGPNWQIAGDRILLRIPGVARILLHAGRDIAVEPEGITAVGDIAIFISGTAFGILLHQRRDMVLHASAVRVGDKAVVFCGPSGAGKSTIAAALGARGYPLLTDDVCVLGCNENGAPVAHSDGRGLSLWADAIRHLNLATRRGLAVRSNFEKYHIRSRHMLAQPLPLGAVYLLRESRPPLHDGIESPSVIDATLLIHTSAYHPRLVADLRQKAGHFLAAAKISAKSGVFFLTRPLDFAGMDGVVGWLENHWRRTGLNGAFS